MSATAEKVDLAALAADATRRLGELEEQRLHLAPEALTDKKAAAELADVESEIAACRRTLERVGLAREEQQRRVLAAEASAREEARQAHLAEARRLQAERETAAVAVDKAAAVFAQKLRAFDRITSEQESHLRRAGDVTAAGIARPRPYLFELALERALRDAGCPYGILRTETLTGVNRVPMAQIRPLVESDARPIAAE